jgi:hypothetical protein
MEEVEGFEPPRDLTPLSVFKTDPFSRTWVYLRINIYYNTLNQNQSQALLEHFFKIIIKPNKKRTVSLLRETVPFILLKHYGLMTSTPRI